MIHSRQPVKDLSDELASQARRWIDVVLETARILLYQARIRDAVDLLDEGAVRTAAGLLTPEVGLRIRVRRAECMLYQAVLDNGGHEAALQILSEVEDSAAELGDRKLVADALHLRAWGTRFREMAANRTYEDVLPMAERSLTLREEIGDEKGIAESLFLLGLCHEYGRVATHDEAHEGIAEAEALYRRAHAIAERIGDRQLLSDISRDLGWLCRRKGQMDEAFDRLQRSLSLRKEIGLKLLVGPAYHTMGVMHLERDEPDQALAYARASLRLAEEIGFRRGLIAPAFVVAGALVMQGQTPEALEAYREGLERAEELDHVLAIAEFRKEIEALVNEVPADTSAPAVML